VVAKNNCVLVLENLSPMQVALQKVSQAGYGPAFNQDANRTIRTE